MSVYYIMLILIPSNRLHKLLKSLFLPKFRQEKVVYLGKKSTFRKKIIDVIVNKQNLNTRYNFFKNINQKVVSFYRDFAFTLHKFK